MCKASSQENVRPDGVANAYSDNLGLQCNRSASAGASKVVFGRTTRSFDNFVTFANAYLNGLLAEILTRPDDPRYSFAKNFRWSSVCVNQNLQCKRHRDRNNLGMSAIIAIGPHRGGGKATQLG